MICWGLFDLRILHLALVIILFHIIAFTYWYNIYKTILMTIHHLCKNIFLTLSEQKMVIQNIHYHILSIRQTIKHMCFKPDPLHDNFTELWISFLSQYLKD